MRNPDRLLTKPRPKGSPSEFIPYQSVVLMDPSQDPDDILCANRSEEKHLCLTWFFDHTATQATAFHFFLFFKA